MNTFLSISTVFILGLFILKLFYEIKKLNNKINKLQSFIAKKVEEIEKKKYVEKKAIATNDASEKNVSESEILNSIKIKTINTNTKTTSRKKRVKPRRKSVEPIQDKDTKHQTPSKNSFLYGAEDFGEMKKGVVLESNTYTYYIGDKGNGFDILPPNTSS
jgi:predicted Holliday junction resolvase-like endonuclease